MHTTALIDNGCRQQFHFVKDKNPEIWILNISVKYYKANTTFISTTIVIYQINICAELADLRPLDLSWP